VTQTWEKEGSYHVASIEPALEAALPYDERTCDWYLVVFKDIQAVKKKASDVCHDRCYTDAGNGRSPDD
jgi:hypothetical protein